VAKLTLRTDARNDNRPGCRIDKRAACRYELILPQALNNTAAPAEGYAWPGGATDDDGKINKSNLLNGGDCVMSAYATSRGKQLWITTRLDGDGGTTVLVPEEY
jgi:hypothetical protein